MNSTPARSPGASAPRAEKVSELWSDAVEKIGANVDQTEIARQYIEESRPDVILGGGEDWWYPEGEEGPLPASDGDDAGSRSEQGNLVEAAQEAGYAYVTDAAGLAPAPNPNLGFDGHHGPQCPRSPGRSLGGAGHPPFRHRQTPPAKQLFALVFE